MDHGRRGRKARSKMGDYLRYALFDKYFKTMGCQSPSCAGRPTSVAARTTCCPGTTRGAARPPRPAAGRGASARAPRTAGTRTRCAAYVLAKVPELQTGVTSAARDWDKSLTRQLEFYRWLQTAEGGIAGGATNGWAGRYDEYPAGTHTFYGMAYDEAPVYLDPPSNKWFGFQVWSMDRVAEYYYVTGDGTPRSSWTAG